MVIVNGRVYSSFALAKTLIISIELVVPSVRRFFRQYVQ